MEALGTLWGSFGGSLARFGEPLEPMGVLLVALESHFAGLGAVFGQKIEYFVEMSNI